MGNALNSGGAAGGGIELGGPVPTVKGSLPLLLHFDVNKTILLSDSLIMKSIEDGVRECVTELFWGTCSVTAAEEKVWDWIGTAPSVEPPFEHEGASFAQGTLQSYQKFCKDSIRDKDERKKAIRSFSLVKNPASKEEMERWVRLALEKMELPKEIVASTEAQESGLKGSTLVMLPAFFYLVAALTRQGRQFAIVFRSFGDDHHKIKNEWNAFCELRHPVFSALMSGLGPLDGSQPGLPDRRIADIHTLYRDAQGPMLILNTFTNGRADSDSWDAWAKAKPKPKEDTRNGREFIREQGCRTVDGEEELQSWMQAVLKDQATAAVKDDWAWWQFSGEESHGGKLMPMLKGEESRQIFFDDNVEIDNPRIVDCRHSDGTPVAAEQALNSLCMKVNPVEALIDKYYFIQKLNRAEERLERSTSGPEGDFALDAQKKASRGWADLLCCGMSNSEREVASHAALPVLPVQAAR